MEGVGCDVGIVLSVAVEESSRPLMLIRHMCAFDGSQGLLRRVKVMVIVCGD